MIKYALNVEAHVEKYCDRAGKGSGVNLKFASKTFGSVREIPQVYRRALANYKAAMESEGNSSRIGSYDPEFHYYRVIAMHGDVANDNGDMFRWGSIEDPTAPELMRYDETLGKNVYQTFVGRGNFKNHQNDDVSKAVGVILDVVPNMNGKFIEALVAVDSKRDPELVRSIDKGYVNAVSMGARVAYSMCSVCGHIAKTEAEYCDHVKNSKGGKIYHNGSFVDVYEDNRGVNFIELSWVTVPADRYALMLEKVAHGGISDDTLAAIGIMIDSFGEPKTKQMLEEIASSSKQR